MVMMMMLVVVVVFVMLVTNDDDDGGGDVPIVKHYSAVACPVSLAALPAPVRVTQPTPGPTWCPSGPVQVTPLISRPDLT